MALAANRVLAARQRQRNRQGNDDHRRVPGVDQKDIEVTVTGDQLQIKGEKKSEIEEKKDKKAARSTVSSDRSDLSRD